MVEQKLISPELDDIVTVDEFIKRHPNLLTKDRFYFLLRNKAHNELMSSGALVKVGREYQLKYKTFSNWLYRYINIYGRD